MVYANVFQLGGGESCTCVVTEYQSPFPEQQLKLAAKIYYYSTSALRDLLGNFVRDYVLYTFELDRDWDEDFKQQSRRRAETAFTTFRSLFCDKEEFENPAAAAKFLDQKKKDPDSVIRLFLSWCGDLLGGKPEVDDSRVEYLEAETRAGFREAIDPLLTTGSQLERPAVWPLVQRVW